MAQSTQFWDKIADEASYQKKLQVTRGYFRPDIEVLEIGCGTGSTALIHAPYVKQIRAIDFSAQMIAIAQDKAVHQNITNVTFEQVSIDNLNLAPQTLDKDKAVFIVAKKPN